MPLLPDDIKVSHQRQMWGRGPGSHAVPCIELTFTVRGQGPYTTNVPLDTYNAQTAMQAMTDFAERIVAVMEQFK